MVLRLCIDAAGNLTQAEIVDKAGSGFDEAALTSVMASSYRPAVRDGQAIPSRAVLRIRFQLSGT